MGLGNKQNSTFLSIIGDKICRRVKEGTEDAVSRVNKLGATVWEVQYDFVEGFLESIETKDGDYGKQWVLSFWDGKEHFTLQLPYSGRVSKAFFSCLPNIDLRAVVRIQPSIRDDKQTLFVSQGGKALKWAYTKDNPNGLPPMKQVKIKGQDAWDDTDQLAFFEQMAIKKMSEKVESPIQEKDDLPF